MGGQERGTQPRGRCTAKRRSSAQGHSSKVVTGSMFGKLAFISAREAAADSTFDGLMAGFSLKPRRIERSARSRVIVSTDARDSALAALAVSSSLRTSASASCATYA